MEQKSKTYIRPIVIVMIFAFITIGYAYLTSVLNINGSTLIKNPTWDVHFENVQVKDGSVIGDQVTQAPEIDTDRTTVSFHVNLKKPGDYYEFTVDAVNAGTIDAMINSYTEFDLTEDQLKYLETSVTYEDGEEIQEKQQLLAGDFAVYKIVVSFKKDLEADDLPSAPEQLDLTYTVEYVQKDDTAIERQAETYLLYNVLKREYDNNGLAKLYAGDHQDSIDATKSIKKIYHWYASSDSEGLSIINKNNVRFADQCWQMIRTTDTGGVRLLYNGEVENNQCLDTRENHVGYYDTSQNSTMAQNLDGNYWFGSNYIYNKNTNTFSLSGDKIKTKYTLSNSDDLAGMYTCISGDENGTCSTLYLIYAYNNSYASAYGMKNVADVLKIDANASSTSIGSFRYDELSNYTLSGAGYMYNKMYKIDYLHFKNYENGFISSNTMNSNSKFFISDSISYSNNYYYLTNSDSSDPLIYNWSSDSSENNSLIGKYTCFNSNSNLISNTTIPYGTRCDGVYYVISVDNDSGIVLSQRLLKGNTTPNGNIKLSSDVIDNNDGTYSLKNDSLITIDRIQWINNHDSYLHYYYCENYESTTCDASKMRYIYNTSLTFSSYLTLDKNYKYAKSFTYSNGVYTLKDNIKQFWDVTNSLNKNSIQNAHYTCANASGTCENLLYIMGYGDDNNFKYITLNDGNGVSDAINEMLYDNNVNVNSSIMKVAIESWFAHSILTYSSYLEDDIFCNNRSISGFGGWNPDGGNLNYYTVSFSPSNQTNLFCHNVTDRFSVSNSLAKLKYPVGLLSVDELVIMGNKNARKGGHTWLMSPAGFYMYPSFYALDYDGSISSTTAWNERSIRPALSLKPGTMFESGDGSKENPYYIKTD